MILGRYSSCPGIFQQVPIHKFVLKHYLSPSPLINPSATQPLANGLIRKYYDCLQIEYFHVHLYQSKQPFNARP